MEREKKGKEKKRKRKRKRKRKKVKDKIHYLSSINRLIITKNKGGGPKN